MQTVASQLDAVLTARDRDLISLFELYDPDYQPVGTHFDPRDALQTFSGVSFTLPFGPVTYLRQVLQGPSIKKTTGKEFNTATLRFSNLREDANGRYMAQFVLQNEVEQMRLVVRVVSRSVASAIGNNISILANSAVLFVGRCGKPDGFNRSTGTISAKPDMGTIERRLPPRDFQASCPLEFKGPECLGTETLGEKSATYQNAFTCNFTHEQCLEYENEEFFQGINLIQIQSSFTHKSNESFFKKILNILPGVSRKVTSVNNSLHDGSPYGKPIPLIFGRWYKTLLPLQYQDIGTSINFLMAACRGKISDFINVRNLSLNFTQPIGVTEHLGEFGGEGTQTQDTVFPPFNFYSRLAYITGYCNGSDIEAEDPAPEVAAIIAGIIPEQIYFDVDHDGTGKLAAGTGGVTAPGSSTVPPASPAASFDAAIFEPGTPEAYWKFDETSFGNTFPTAPGGIEDFSGNGHHAWYNDFATGGTVLDISTPEVPVETDPTSRFVSGGVGGLPTSAGSALDLVGSQTWIAIARMTTHTSQSYIINRGTDTVGGVAFALTFGDGISTTTLYATWGNGAIGGARLSYDGIVDDGRPYLIVTTREGSVIKLFVNGCLVDQRSDFATGDIEFPDYNNSAWRFGYTPNIIFGAVAPSQGLSRIALCDFAWTDQQVSRLWASMRTTPTGCPGEDWTDNPVDHTLHILTDPALMGNDTDSIDHHLSAYAAAWCCRTVRDDSNAERCLLADTETAKAGVDYKRYNSTGLLTPLSFQATRTQIPAGVPARECDYEFFDPANPPTSLTAQTVYRKGNTCNIELAQPEKAVDVLYDRIFPTGNLFLRWNIKGQTIIDSARPADWTKLHSAASATDTTIAVNDVLPWKNTLGSPYLLEGKVHISIQPTWIYADAAHRTNASDFTSADVGKFARQIRGNSLWKLTDDDPATWMQVQDLSEVRAVTLAQYSTAGNSITLAASASGGPSAVASGANLSGGSSSVQASATVTITGSLTEDAIITVTIDGVACVLTLLDGESSSTIGHRMACVINATPEIQEYVEAHAEDNVVTIYAKVGVLTLASALQENHAIGEEVTRVMASFAGRALAYADTLYANILDGTFQWPDASRQSSVNQVKTKYRESVRDFGEQPITVNDFNHQRKTRKVNTFEVDHSAIDNYNQSARLANGLLNKLRDGDKFFEWASKGRALLLDEGDVVCVSDASGPFRNQLVRIEDININNNLDVTFNARKYSRLQFSDLVAEPASVLLASALTNFESAPPAIQFNEEDFPPDGLIQTTDGTAGITSIRGGVIFGASIYAQYAKIRLIKRGGVTVDEWITTDLRPNADREATFEFIASTDGLYTVEAQACNQWGCSATVTAPISIGLGAAQGVWITPMIQFSGEGTPEWIGTGIYNIPMITESGAGEPEPAGGGNYDIP